MASKIGKGLRTEVGGDFAMEGIAPVPGHYSNNLKEASMRKSGLFWIAAIATSGVLARTYFSRRQNRASRKILPDVTGNYDIDGVSYDNKQHEVTVSGDALRGGEIPESLKFTH